MPATLTISNIAIDPASETVSPKMNRATITVQVHWTNRGALELKLFVADYASIDAAVEDVRQQISTLADELKEAASRPLTGTHKNP